MGPSHDSSMLLPWVKAPAAMMTWSLYPGISPATGVTKASIGLPS